MAFKLFGFRFGRQLQKEENTTVSIVPPTNDDGALTLEVGSASSYNIVYDLEGTINSEIDLINKYRDMSIYSEVESAIDEVVNDLVIVDQESPPVNIVIGDNLKFSDNLKNKIEKEFKNVLRLLNFQNNAYDITRRWFIDAKLYYQVVIDEQAPQEGIKELRYIDPRMIKKMREVTTEKNGQTGIDEVKDTSEYFIFNRNGWLTTDNRNTSGIKITVDNIVFCHSGLLNRDNTMILSHLHKAIKPYNQLRAMEDALVIYRITRAPERRIFNIDVGDMPPAKAKQYIQDIMTNYKNKLVYNPVSGEIRDDRRHSTILEDFWFPKRADRTNEVTTLPGGQNLSEIDDIIYFQKKLYKSLNIPISRLDPENGFSIGHAAEVTREEVKFSKFITRLRFRFSHLFDEILKRQLILKKITTPEDWEMIKENIYYDFLSDSYFAELKKSEILKGRLDILDQADQYTDKYFSKTYVRTEILMQTEDEMEAIDKQIEGKEEKPEDTSPEEAPEESPEELAPEPDTSETPEEEPAKVGGSLEEPVPEVSNNNEPEEA